MGYTAHGRQQRANLQKASQMGKDMLALFRPIVATIPKVVIERTKAGSSYSKYKPFWLGVREKRGLQTGHKDFYFSGEMWNSYKIVKEGVTDVGVSFELGTTAGKGSNGQFLSDIHSAERTTHAKGGTQGEGELILALTDEEWDNIVDQMWDVFNKATSGLFK